MNNENKKPNFMAGKGLYIVLFLCISAIGISGYFLADSLFSRTNRHYSGGSRYGTGKRTGRGQ